MVLSLSQFSFADDRQPLAIAPLDITPVANLTSVLTIAPREKDAYALYFESQDAALKSAYINRWGDSSAQSRWHYEYATPDRFQSSANALSEAQSRGSLAGWILQVRVNTAINSYLSGEDRPRTLRNTQAALNTIKDVAIATSEDSEDPAQLKIGYDWQSDRGRVEYGTSVVRGIMSVTGPLGMMAGPAIVQFHFQAQFSRKSAMFTFDYATNEPVLRAAIGKALLPGLDITFLTSQTLEQPTNTSSYEIRFAIGL